MPNLDTYRKYKSIAVNCLQHHPQRPKPAAYTSTTDLFLNPALNRVGLLDIETTGLNGDFAVIFCVVVKVYGKREVRTFVTDIDKTDLLEAEAEMLEKLSVYIETLDGMITYYGTNFDVPFLRTRMLAHGIRPFDKKKHLDVYYTARRTLNLSRNRLQNVIELLQTSDRSVPTKGRVEPRLWVRALYARDRKALAAIVKHCVEDVHALEAALNKLLDFAPDRVMRR